MKNFICGGYISISWPTCNYNNVATKDDPASFMFSINRNAKLNAKNNGKDAVRTNPSYFLLFGLGDFILQDSCNKSNINRADIGSSFILPEGIERNTTESKTYLVGEE